MADQFNQCVAWLVSAVVAAWSSLSGSLGFWFWLLVSAGAFKRIFRLIHKVFHN